MDGPTQAFDVWFADDRQEEQDDSDQEDKPAADAELRKRRNKLEEYFMDLGIDLPNEALDEMVTFTEAKRAYIGLKIRHRRSAAACVF